MTDDEIRLRDALTAAEARVAELENAAILSRAAYDGLGSLLLSVQQDCIKERNRAEAAMAMRDAGYDVFAAAEARIAELEAALKAADSYIDKGHYEMARNITRAAIAKGAKP